MSDESVTAGLSVADAAEVEKFAAKLRDKKGAAAQRRRCCSKCHKFMDGQTGDDLLCDRCLERIVCCVLCGDKTSEEVCPDCIAAGATTCEFCLRPAPAGASMCLKCNQAYQGQAAEQYKENVAAPSPQAMYDGRMAGL